MTVITKEGSVTKMGHADALVDTLETNVIVASCKVDTGEREMNVSKVWKEFYFIQTIQNEKFMHKNFNFGSS